MRGRTWAERGGVVIIPGPDWLLVVILRVRGVWCYLSRGVGIEGAWGAAVEGVWSLLGAAPRCGTAEWVLEGKKVGRGEGEIVR